MWTQAGRADCAQGGWSPKEGYLHQPRRRDQKAFPDEVMPQPLMESNATWPHDPCALSGEGGSGSGNHREERPRVEDDTVPRQP